MNKADNRPANASYHANNDPIALIWLGTASDLLTAAHDHFITYHVTSIRAAMHALQHGMAACLVVDFATTPQHDIKALVAGISEQWPATRIIALNGEDDIPASLEIARTLPRGCDIDTLAQAVEAVIADINTPPTLADYYELQERAQHLEGLVQASLALAGSDDIRSLLSKLDVMGRISVGADRIAVLLANDDYTRLNDALDLDVPDAYLAVCHAHLQNLSLEERMLYLGDEILLRERLPGILPSAMRVREAEAAGAWSYMRLPLNLNERLAGFVAFFSDQPGAFDGAHLQLGRLFTTQVTEALRTMQQYLRVTGAEERQRAITRVAQVIAQDLALDDVLSQIVEQAVQLVQGNSGCVLLVQPDQNLTVSAIYNIDACWLNHTIERGIDQAGIVALTGRPSVVTDYPNWKYANPDIRAKMIKDTLLIAVPLTYRGITLGVLQVGFKDTPSGELTDIRDALMMLAPQAAIAIAKAQLHETVRQEQRQLQAILDQTPVGVLVVDPQGSVLRVNREAARILGLLHVPVDAIEGSNIARLLDDLLPHSDADTLLKRFNALEISLGKAGEYLITVAPITNDDGDTVEAYIAVAQNITALRHLDQMRANLHRVLTHDLGNLIMLARSPLELLDDPELSDEQRDQLKEMLSNSLIRMQNLISDVTDLEMADTMGHETFVPYDLVALTQRVINQNKSNAAANNIKLSFKTERAPEKLLQGHSVLIIQAIDNLVSNAIKYTPPGGQVSVTVDVEGPEAIVRVTDTGFGIPEHQLETIFRPFVRVRDDNTREIQGTGLGLSLVKAFVETHGGQVHVSSTYGKGSTFAIHLPLESLEEPRALDGSVPRIDLTPYVDNRTAS